MKKRLQHVNRRLTDEERSRHARIRETVVDEIPPLTHASGYRRQRAFPRKSARAREARRWTWYALARRAGIPNQATVRDIEQGKDVKLSNLQAVAAALGLTLELAEQRS